MKIEDYKVGWICALPTEMAAAVCTLDERHGTLPQPETDENNYTLGRIKSQNIVIACLPAGVTGVTSAARVADQMRMTFTSLHFGLMVGIGGGVPSERHDIRLGDVVVSKPGDTSGGVIQYDFGKTVQQGRFVRTGSLNRPPDVLLNAVNSLQARHMYEESRIPKFMADSVARYPLRQQACTYLGASSDQLYRWQYDHPIGESTCGQCDSNELVIREPRMSHNPRVHYGLIASGNEVIRDGVTRERLQKDLNVLCFEMEAAGLMDRFPCLVVRGICDYADSHKNKRWQDYAAATAAAYAKELINVIPSQQVVSSREANDLIGKQEAGKVFHYYGPVFNNYGNVRGAEHSGKYILPLSTSTLLHYIPRFQHWKFWKQSLLMTSCATSQPPCHEYEEENVMSVTIRLAWSWHTITKKVRC
jgi:nucleoside phosphorylase